MQIVGVLVILAGGWIVQCRPDAETPLAPGHNAVEASASEAGGYMAANNPWTKDPHANVNVNDPVYFPTCGTARAAGAAPIERGAPGFRRELDSNGDGVACGSRDRG